MGDEVLNIFLSNNFHKKATFSEEMGKNNFLGDTSNLTIFTKKQHFPRKWGKTTFWGTQAFFRRRGDRMPKINTYKLLLTLIRC